MELLRITGGARLRGSVAISGSKNATLPIMAAALLTDEPVELSNVPDIEDIETMGEMLRHLGVEVTRLDASSWRLHAARVRTTDVGADLTKKMRGSFLLLGALLARAGAATIARPGGDDIGMRRVEQHLEGLRAMGARVEEGAEAYVATTDGMHGARIDLDIPTVTGTENLMMAAALARGITVIGNAAREPHVVDLARFLRGMGAHVNGAGTELVVIEGVGGLLHGTAHRVTTDYIEAGTYMVAAAATGGDVVVERMRPSDLDFLVRKLRAAGCEVVEGGRQVRVVAAPSLRPVDVTTWPHPGFASDLQSQFVALMTQATGTSIVSEAIYENRFRVVEELGKLGAEVTVDGRSAVVHGPSRLRGSRVAIPDIRSGAALVIAALCAQGTTELEGVFHLDRGYEDLEGKLRMLGANVERVAVGPPGSAVRDLSGVVGD
ncbi:MAG TPA: UDP-N-acetylglucosamine 1-carboxyvinyltransferase [Candidatus Dormibacteraeota bacterium]|jgi:UDP-N-acetylglucosamine 1-carboxyvinyltransferase|nr:UDP-N-acetylglucosamine 1-carboxyvinyltransferase [Candidatus Dormibacteraeota bacterium]